MNAPSIAPSIAAGISSESAGDESGAIVGPDSTAIATRGVVVGESAVLQ